MKSLGRSLLKGEIAILLVGDFCSNPQHYEGYDFSMLRKFCKMFPLNAVARIILAYFRHKGLPMREETDEEKEKAKEKEKGGKELAPAVAVAAVPVEDPLEIILVSRPF
jgi:hypothetical protein